MGSLNCQLQLVPHFLVIIFFHTTIAQLSPLRPMLPLVSRQRIKGPFSPAGRICRKPTGWSRAVPRDYVVNICKGKEISGVKMGSPSHHGFQYQNDLIWMILGNLHIQASNLKRGSCFIVGHIKKKSDLGVRCLWITIPHKNKKTCKPSKYPHFPIVGCCIPLYKPHEIPTKSIKIPIKTINNH